LSIQKEHIEHAASFVYGVLADAVFGSNIAW
jgi:hypothetical protein